MACDRLRPVYERTGGLDGRVSIEVSPRLAHDTRGTIEEARRLHQAVGRDNLMVKIPATLEGLPAIATCLAEGICINVTLTFSLARYEQVMDAYLSGLEQRAAKSLPLQPMVSVASFFVSRVDTKVDKAIDEAVKELPEGTPARAELESLKGQAAVANARLAYARFRQPAVGLDQHQESGLPRHPLRRRADRPGHGEHHAAPDARRLQRPRSGGSAGRARPRSGARAVRAAAAARHPGRGPDRSARAGGSDRLRPVLRRAHRGPREAAARDPGTAPGEPQDRAQCGDARDARAPRPARARELHPAPMGARRDAVERRPGASARGAHPARLARCAARDDRRDRLAQGLRGADLERGLHPRGVARNGRLEPGARGAEPDLRRGPARSRAHGARQHLARGGARGRGIARSRDDAVRGLLEDGDHARGALAREALLRVGAPGPRGCGPGVRRRHRDADGRSLSRLRDPAPSPGRSGG